MSRIFRLFTNLYAKLTASAAVGVLLVGGMILNEQWSNGTIAGSNAESRNQNAVVKEVLNAEQLYLRGQIQRRNVVLAHNLNDAQQAFNGMKDSATQALTHAKAAAGDAVDPENRARLEQFTARLGEFLAISTEMANSHFTIMKLQQRQVEAMIKWNKAVDTLLALPGLKESDVANTRVREAGAAMQDTNVAYWRYATLEEPVVL